MCVEEGQHPKCNCCIDRQGYGACRYIIACCQQRGDVWAKYMQPKYTLEHQIQIAHGRAIIPITEQDMLRLSPDYNFRGPVESVDRVDQLQSARSLDWLIRCCAAQIAPG